MKDYVNKTEKLFIKCDVIQLLEFFLPGIQRMFTRFPSRKITGFRNLSKVHNYSNGCNEQKRVSQIFSHTA